MVCLVNSGGVWWWFAGGFFLVAKERDKREIDFLFNIILLCSYIILIGCM